MGKFLWYCPAIYHRNHAFVMARRRACKAGEVPPCTFQTIPPSWVYKGRCDMQWKSTTSRLHEREGHDEDVKVQAEGWPLNGSCRTGQTCQN
jgi:hypothetical protein